MGTSATDTVASVSEVLFAVHVIISPLGGGLTEFTSAGKHRKHPGGRGNAGGMHHHRINFDK